MPRLLAPVIAVLLTGAGQFFAATGCGPRAETTAGTATANEGGMGTSSATPIADMLGAGEGGGGLGGGIGGLAGGGAGTPGGFGPGAGGGLTPAAGGEVPQVEGNAAFMDRKVVRNGVVRMRVDDVDSSLADITNVVTNQGGEIVKLDRFVETYREVCELDIRVPAGKFTGVLGSVRTSGEVLEYHVWTEDVTEDYVDLQMRLANETGARDRFIEIMNAKTGNLMDVVSLQQQINATTENIERLTGKRRYVDNRVAWSTIKVSLEKEIAGPTPVKGRGARFREEFHANVAAGGDTLAAIAVRVLRWAIVAAPLALGLIILACAGWRAARWLARRGITRWLFPPLKLPEKE